MPTGVYQRTEKHSYNKGRKHVNRKKPISKGLTPIPKTCLFCKKDFITNCFMPRKKYCSMSCRAKANPHTFNELARLRQRESARNRKGDKHPRWIKDRTEAIEKHRLRGTPEWSEWRETVFTRDNFTCQECMIKGGKLEPHHIVPLRLDMTKVYDVDNGITLCRPCHKETMWKEELFAERYSQKVLTKL